MANDLTGDFDVVAEFAVLAVNRVLAAMHRCERFPHSMTLRVDDNPPAGSQVVRPSIVGSVDTFGDATVNHNHIGTRSDLLGQFSAADPRYWALDGVVNTDVVGANDPPVVPSKLQGRAQLQLAAPTIEVTDASGSNITVKLPVMARYFHDPHTPRVADFVRGELQITAPVDQVASPDPNNVRMIDIDIKADSVNINFDPKWSSQPVSVDQPLSAEDLAAVNLLIRNALKTSFLPSSNPLPSNINYMQFKTLLGAQSAIGVLLNLGDTKGNPASMNKVFLDAGDDFGFAVGSDFIVKKFREQLALQPPSGSFLSYTISVNSPTLELQNDQIVLSVTGHAHSSVLPDFGFTFTQAFTLNLAATIPGGPLDTAALAVLGDISHEVHGLSFVFNWIADDFIGWALDPIRKQRDSAVWVHQPEVVDMFGADKNLGGFLKSLLNPAHPQPGVPPPQDVNFVLAYTSLKIGPSGIVLHGSLVVTAWPAAHAEFQQISSTSGGGGLIPHGPDYSALLSWIPGGTIQSYEWSMQGQAQPFLIDVNKFVLIHPPPQISDGTVSTGAVSGTVSTGATAVSIGPASTGAVSGFVPICLTVRGERIASSGPAGVQPVSATQCGYTRVSILEGVESTPGGALLMVALTQPGPGGLVEVVGHASARPDEAGGGAPNRIVHFADEKTAGHLEFLLQALRESKREDATAVVAVLTTDQLAKARYTEGVIYAEDQGGAWARAFGVKTTRRPVTLIVGPKGNIVWQHEGDIDSEKLAAALGKNLARAGSVRLRMLGLSLRIGRPAPNFLFEYAPGRGLTLRKLAGRAVVLVFWKSSSKPSIETLRDLQKPTGKAGGQGPVVLGINDGEPAELAMKAAAEHGLSATIVTDPERSIALAYGVSIWPTMVFLGASGLVTGIRYGRSSGDAVASPSGQKPAASR